MSVSTAKSEDPFRLNLEQQKKRAKELLKAFNASQQSAIIRFHKQHPKFINNHLVSDIKPKLSDSQLVIARELGLVSWAKLKSHINAMTESEMAIKSNRVTPDQNLTTLHIRCGSDLEKTLPAAGFTGDFLHYSDPYGQGPLNNNKHIKTRSNFLYKAFGQYINKSLEDIQNDLEQEQKKLSESAEKYQRVVLWFEHDSFDQLILARLLDHYNQHTLPYKLELISLNHFPGTIKFIGLGQLPAEAIRLLWQDRKVVTQQQLKLGARVWEALNSASPLDLYNLIQTEEIHALPNMKGALYRHLKELPSTKNGLSLTEQLTLEMLNEGELTAGKLFSKLTLESDPLPWLGDIMFWFILESMMQASEAVIKISVNDLNKPWQKRTLSITEKGQQVLAGNLDWLSLQPPVRWLGGIFLEPESQCWRWDTRLDKPVLC